MHFALVVPDLKTYRALRDAVWAIKPHGWNGEVRAHVLVQKGREAQDVLFSFALTELGLVHPNVARLQYPEELEIGWSDATAPINTERYPTDLP